MTAAPEIADGLSRTLARLLGVGTLAACGLVAIGMILPARSIGTPFVSAGVVLLIALPALRVAVMGVWLLVNHDGDLALVAALVLAIIIVSTLLGAGIV